MGRTSVFSLLVLLSSAVVAPAQSKEATPRSVSCLEPEGEAYVRDLLTRIHELEQELDATKRAAAREAKAREEAQERIAEFERRGGTAAVSSRRAVEVAPPPKEPSPPAAAGSETPLPSGASETGRGAQTEGVPSAKVSEGELAAALRGESPLPASSPPAPPAPGEAPQSERILPGERLTLRVPEMDELNRTVEVRDDGSIDLPLLGAIQAAGRTESQLVADLRERLTAYLKRPRVEVSRVR
jgi:hypothetical protein